MASHPSKSKKQFGGSKERQPPEDFVIYLDENLHNCKPILEVLVRNGVKHERHGQHFAPGTEDTIWLPLVGKNGWALLTKDKRIRFNELERAAVVTHRVREFYFTSGNYSGAEMAEILVGALPEMIKSCQKHQPPFIASISKAGKVTLRLF
jgi:PIN domain-containing protein